MTESLGVRATHVSFGWAAAAALLMLLPHVSASPFVGEYDSQRLLEVAAWAVLACAVAARPAARAAWLRTWDAVPRWAVILLTAVLALGVASAAGAARPVYAFAEVASFVAMAVTAVAAASTGRVQARHGMALVAVALLGGYAVSALPLHVTDLLSGATDLWPRRHLGFGHVRHLNQVQLWTLPLVWALAASSGSAWRRAGLRAVAASAVMFGIASGGRGAALGLAAGTAVALLSVPSRRWAFAREAGLAVGLGLVAKLLLFPDATTVLNRLASGSSGRVELWAGTLRMIRAHPVLGVGPMHVAYYPSPYAAHPHNIGLQMAAEWGIPAAMLLAAVALGGGIAWVRHARNSVDPLWAAGCTAALAGSLANAMVDGVVIAPMSQIVAALAIGALLAEALPCGSDVRVPSTATAGDAARRLWLRPALLAAVALMSASVLLAVCLSDVARLGRRTYDFSGSMMSTDLPRFWSTGQIAGRLPPDQARIWPETVDPHDTPTATIPASVGENYPRRDGFGRVDATMRTRGG